MAEKKSKSAASKAAIVSKPKRTSIGRSVHSRPNSKNAKRSWKRYRGQG